MSLKQLRPDGPIFFHIIDFFFNLIFKFELFYYLLCSAFFSSVWTQPEGKGEREIATSIEKQGQRSGGIHIKVWERQVKGIEYYEIPVVTPSLSTFTLNTFFFITHVWNFFRHPHIEKKIRYSVHLRWRLSFL